jgi:hypothetical protein
MGCAWEWGGWGRLSVDGPRQKNSDRSEGPWGRAAEAARTEVLQRATPLGTERGRGAKAESTKGEGKLIDAKAASPGKALSDQPALKPYWGKPAVRNFREGNGNVGIIRSPLRAIALPDQSGDSQCPPRSRGVNQPNEMEQEKANRGWSFPMHNSQQAAPWHRRGFPPCVSAKRNTDADAVQIGRTRVAGAPQAVKSFI